ncbi:tripartite tricarboxylate transporter TctB family protein [Puniceibacterium sediminis]|uniref:Tripartite tricarboxylate transporter TctB family protein n=1 Tax=Puniceibacterium sediminis TaxID=1608407 RepID=A0A238XZM0_9RHOB|nr:tripartite tricarboxylate transporter TctB family protein [Puniceibacterium sediminis]SNR63971.1 Tripartite tricarboxylate transporter TctB family protein [Puniceibacterium sediminis]
MIAADRLIAAALMALSVYFMVHATVLPIGWNGETGGPGGGGFPFWLSAIMFAAAGGILIRTFRPGARTGSFFDLTMIRSVLAVVVALIVTIALMPVVGTYIALPLFLFWYLRIFGDHRWAVTLPITILTPVFLFFFFEVTVKILLPKGITEPLFYPLYAMFF